MRCEVLLFAGLADAAGTRRIMVDLADGARVADLLEKVCSDHRQLEGQLHGQLQGLRQTIAVAVNERYVDESTALADGDVVALIPPVSGG